MELKNTFMQDQAEAVFLCCFIHKHKLNKYLKEEATTTLCVRCYCESNTSVADYQWRSRM